MEPSKGGQPYDTAHIIERQMLLHDALDRALHSHPESHPNLRYRFITLSRDKGSLGDAVALELAKRLGWSVYDREIVDYIAKNSHVHQHLVQQLDERSQNLAQETVQRFLRMAEGSSFGVSEYREALQKTLAYLATQGDAILVGRGANFALSGESGGLHIRIMASPQVRLQRLSMRWHVTIEEARWRMEENDIERHNFIRHHFRRNVDDPAAYDLVFNTDRLPPMQVVDSILSAVIIS